MAGAHDQLGKELIRAFPADFVRLILSGVAAQIDLTAIDFRSEEFFTESPRGGRPRRPDLTAEVPVLGSDEEVILHGEIEARYRKARVPGLCEYNRMLTLRYGKSVHTAVVYCRGGTPGIQEQEFRVESLGRSVAAVYYVSWGLSRTPAAEYLARREPLAWAFAALMLPGEIGGRAELRVQCLRRIVGVRHLEEGQRFLLFNFVASYIESGRGISEEYEELFRQEDNREVHETMMTWAERRLEEGRQQGEAALLARMVMRKFGPLSQGVQQTIESADAEQLLEWGDRFVTARSVEEIFDGKG